MSTSESRATAASEVFVHLDPRAAASLQAQIYAGLRRAILDGRLAPGARLPSSRALAADLGVSRTTTLLVFDQLVAEGYLTPRAGSGMFVSGDLPDDRLAGPRPSRRPVRHPTLSTRARQLAAVPLITERAGASIRPFRLGTPAIDAFPVAIWSRLTRRHLQRWTRDQLDYGPTLGLPALRAAIAAHVSRSRGTSCAADQVIVTAGAQQGLELAFRLLLDPGDPAAIEDPGYPGTVGALLSAGAQIRPVPVDADGLDVEALAITARGARLACVTPSHQFPLGVTMSLPRRLALLAWARRTGAWIVEDDYDSEFRYGARPVPCLHGLDRGGRVVYVGTFSKTLFPALRVGFVIVPPDLHEQVQRVRRQLDIHPATAPQAVLADFIADGHFERHLHRMRREYRARLEALEAALARHCAGALALRPVTTGLHAVADLDGADDRTVAEAALARGIEVMPLSSYVLDRTSATANGLVLGFGAVRPELLDRGAAVLAEAIEGRRKKG